MTNEARLIERIQEIFGPLVAPGAYGFLDDAAMVPPVAPFTHGEKSRVITTDVVVEGVDFERSLYPTMYAGYRALAQNVSDLSAMGALPVGFVWSLALPRPWLDDTHDLFELVRGAAVLAKLRTVPLFGGDLSSTTGPLVVSITAFGDVDGLPVRRAGARPGDVLWLSARVGGSAAGLRLLQARKERGGPVDKAAFDAWLRDLDDDSARCVRDHLMPLPGDPRVLVHATSCIDVSDGLSLDAARLAHASGVRLELDALDDAVAPGATRVDALLGGEDYALLFTAPEGARIDGIRLGRVVEGEGVWEAGVRLEAKGFDHFATPRGTPERHG
jgi:thiamine-monophosphate kinase